MKTEKTEIIYGIHPIAVLLKKAPHRIVSLLFAQQRQDQRLQEIREWANQTAIEFNDCPREELDKIIDAQHQGVIAFCKPQSIHTESDLENILDDLTQPAFLLVLDGVQDPHNLGACLRSAEASGVHAVIIPKDRAVSLTPVVRKAASGAAELIPLVEVTNLARSLRNLKRRGIWVWGAEASAPQSIFQTDFTGSIALVLGAEGSGLRRLTQEQCDGLFAIPLRGAVSSLNVSVAVGISLFEALRQRF